MVIRRHRTPAIVTLLRVLGETTHNDRVSVGYRAAIAGENPPRIGRETTAQNGFIYAMTDSDERGDTHSMVTAP
jgi:hypothetical protein